MSMYDEIMGLVESSIEETNTRVEGPTTQADYLSDLLYNVAAELAVIVTGHNLSTEVTDAVAAAFDAATEPYRGQDRESYTDDQDRESYTAEYAR